MVNKCFVRGCRTVLDYEKRKRRETYNRLRGIEDDSEEEPVLQNKEVVLAPDGSECLSIDKLPTFGEYEKHMFAAPRGRIEEWREVIPKRRDKEGKVIEFTYKHSLCHKHFAPESFNYEYIVKDGKKLYLKSMNKRLRLKKGTIPTIFPGKIIKRRKPPRERSFIIPKRDKQKKVPEPTVETIKSSIFTEYKKRQTAELRGFQMKTPPEWEDEFVQLEIEMSDSPGPSLFDNDFGSVSPAPSPAHNGFDTPDDDIEIFDFLKADDENLPLSRYLTYEEILNCVKEKELHLPSPNWIILLEESQRVVCINRNSLSQEMVPKLDISLLFKSSSPAILRINGRVMDDHLNFISISSLINYLMKLDRRRICEGISSKLGIVKFHPKCPAFLNTREEKIQCSFCNAQCI